MTNDGVYKSSTVNDYVQDNQHWTEPRHTMRGLPHNEVIDHISRSKVFCSSHEFETTVREFAITMKDRRDEIAEMTREKHSLIKWKSCIDKVINMRYDDKNKSRSDLTEFFI